MNKPILSIMSLEIYTIGVIKMQILRKRLMCAILIICPMFSSVPCYAATIEYNIGGNPAGGATVLNPIINDQSGTLSAGSLSPTIFGIQTPIAGVFFSDWWNYIDGNGDRNSFQWSVSGNGSAFELESVSFSLMAYNHSNFIGPNEYLLYASTDGLATQTLLGSYSLATHNVQYLYEVSDFSALGVNPYTDIVFSLYGYGATHNSSMGGFSNNSSAGTGSNLVVQVSTVPIPAAIWLFGSGLLGLVGFARRKA